MSRCSRESCLAPEGPQLTLTGEVTTESPTSPRGLPGAPLHTCCVPTGHCGGPHTLAHPWLAMILLAPVPRTPPSLPPSAGPSSCAPAPQSTPGRQAALPVTSQELQEPRGGEGWVHLLSNSGPSSTPLVLPHRLWALLPPAFSGSPSSSRRNTTFLTFPLLTLPLALSPPPPAPLPLLA